MSASLHELSGVFNFDPRVPSDPDTRRLSCSAAETFTVPGLLMRCVPWESPFVISPGLATASGCCCACDGRLDNRAELMAVTAGNLPDSPTDAAIVLELYRRFGDASLARLIGDWSIVLYDAFSRSILLASDFAGVRPLYYCRTDARLLWSSSLEQLASCAETHTVDEGYVAQLLLHGYATQRTPYRGIESVPPGSVVRVSAHSTTARRFWNLPVSNEIRYSCDREYENHFRSLFQEAVACRLEPGVACAELSGGLDSSSIVCVASQLIRAKSEPSARLATFTYVEERSTDRPFYTAVERACSPKAVHIDTAAFPPVSRSAVGTVVPMWWEARYDEIARAMAGMQSRVLLTGQLGDLITGNWFDDSEQIADHLVARRLLQSVSEAFSWSRSLRVPVWSLLWRSAAAAAGREPSASNGDFAEAREESDAFGDSLTPAVRSYAQRSSNDTFRHARPSLRKRLATLEESLQARRLECPTSLRHISYTHPFLHRPLVDFLLRIPSGIVCGPGEPRRLMRRALAGILPQCVLMRRSKGSYAALFMSCLRSLATELLQDVSRMQLVQYGYVDAVTLTTRLERLVQGLPCNEGQLRSVILLEFWLRKRTSESTLLRPPCRPFAIA